MDSSVASDPRFKLVAAALGIKWTEVVGSSFLLWLACYERRSERLRKVEADVAAELSGFADALVSEGLADDCGDGTIIVHGVTERIEFLKRQAERGAKGGKSKKKPSAQANAKQTLEQPLKQTAQTAQAYTLTPAPALSPTLTQDMGGRAKATKGCALPPTWSPTEAHHTLAAELYVDLDREAGNFRDHAEASGRVQKNWDASFRLWLKKAGEWVAEKDRNRGRPQEVML